MVTRLAKTKRTKKPLGKKTFTDAMHRSIYLFDEEPKASDLSKSLEPVHIGTGRYAVDPLPYMGNEDSEDDDII